MPFADSVKKAEYHKEYRKTHPEILIYLRNYRKKNPDKVKNIDLKRTHGITLEQYQLLLKQQDGVCAICKRPEFVLCSGTGKARYLAVDHNHSTGKIRALLCTNCNKAVGHLKDSPELAKACLEYLEFHEGA